MTMHGHWKAHRVGAVAAIAMMRCGGGGGGGNDGPPTCPGSFLGASIISGTNSTSVTPTGAELTTGAAVDRTSFHTATTRFEQATGAPIA
jgi:hypothetical protein